MYVHPLGFSQISYCGKSEDALRQDRKQSRKQLHAAVLQRLVVAGLLLETKNIDLWQIVFTSSEVLQMARS